MSSIVCSWLRSRINTLTASPTWSTKTCSDSSLVMRPVLVKIILTVRLGAASTYGPSTCAMTLEK